VNRVKPAVTADTEAGSRRGFLLRVLGVLSGGALVSSCGYALAGTTIFNLETMLTEKVRAEFIGRGKYQILPESTGVDALLTGEVTSVSLVPASFTTEQLASRYALTMTARIELRDIKENKILWENPSLMFRQEYEATSGTGAADPAAFFQQNTNALERMSTEFARTIVSAILEAF
jgi:hypothetical protein